jgi:uncharacterized surface protein with fasciclin (FAS1) repeats
MRNHRSLTAIVGLAAGLTLVAAACGSDGNDSPTAPASPTTQAADQMTPAPSASNAGAGAMQAAMPFGPACSSVPADGAGSFAGMAQDPAATAASNNPALSTLVSAVSAAGLVDTLNGPGPFTIFAPANTAFAKIDPATLDTLLADPKGDLTKILTYHVVAGQKLSADELVKAGSLKTVEGDAITIAQDGSTVKVNGSSSVVCGNIETANATVFIIDNVLTPPTT